MKLTKRIKLKHAAKRRELGILADHNFLSLGYIKNRPHIFKFNRHEIGIYSGIKFYNN